MRIIKKMAKVLMSLVIGLCFGLSAFLMFQMYKPVMDASKPIEGIGEYAHAVTDELVNRDVKIIGLGEATHGNKEFQELKLDVLKTLVRDNGVSALCFEMDYGEGVLVNEYIQGKSDMTSEELFSHISFGIYHTEEMKGLIEWMREYNADSRDGCLEFYGFDIQNPEVAIYVIHEFAKARNMTISSEAIDAFLKNEFSFRDDRMNEVFETLSTFREELTSAEDHDSPEVYRIIKCIDNVFLTKELAAIPAADGTGYGTYRDKAMADNCLEISGHVGYPIMLAGHNGHVGYAGSYVKTMGSYLKEVLGDDYFVIGTDYFKTTASIKAENGRKNHSFYSGDPLAYQAKKLGTYYLRFEDLKEDEKLNAIITNKMPTGSLGESYSILNHLMAASVRVYAPPTDLFDAMIFVYEATPFTMLND